MNLLSFIKLQQQFFSLYNTRKFPASTSSGSNSSGSPLQQLWKVFSRPAVDWLMAGLILDEGRGMNQRPVSQIVWCRKHPNLCYCFPSLSCSAIHRAEDRVLHSLCDSFTQDRSTMKSEKQWLPCSSHLYHLSSSISGLQADRWWHSPPQTAAKLDFSEPPFGWKKRIKKKRKLHNMIHNTKTTVETQVTKAGFTLDCANAAQNRNVTL